MKKTSSFLKIASTIVGGLMVAVHVTVLQGAIKAIKGKRLNLTNEKTTQAEIYELIKDMGFVREFHLNDKDIPDFFHKIGIVIEVKIKGSKMEIYRQCERYCQSDKVTGLILCTKKPMGFPKEINGKPCYFISLSAAWL